MKHEKAILFMGEKMKNLLFISMISFLLCGCSVFSKNITEQTKPITIYMENEQYANSLQQLWIKTYPKNRNALRFVKKLQKDVDLRWSDDTFVRNHKEQLKPYAITYEYDVPKHMIEKDLKSIYTPMIMQGYVFCYRDDILKKQYHQENIETFEQIIEKQIPYYTNYLDYNIYPFFYDTYHSRFMKEYRIKKRMKQYKQLIQQLNMKQSTEYNHIFYEIEPYVCGLLYTNDGFEKSESYKKGNLRFQAFPTWKQKSLPLPIKTYGFTVLEHCKNNVYAKQFLQLVRSQEGIQCLLDLNIKVPIIASKDIDCFDIYDYGKKELIQTMNASELFDHKIWMKESEWLQQNIYMCSEFASILQNYVCSNQGVDQLYQSSK